MQFSLNFLRNKLLVASPSLQDKYFHQSVVYIYEHSDKNGTIGFILNKPSCKNLKEILFQTGIINHTFSCPPTQPVFLGGPCYENEIFLMIPETSQNRLELNLMTPKEAQIHFSHNNLPENLLFLSGYAAWKPKQLEEEIRDNAWLLVSHLDEKTLTMNYQDCWLAHMNTFGINPETFFDIAGHA